MKIKVVLSLAFFGFVVFCGVLVAESGLFETGSAESRPCILLQQSAIEAVEKVSEPAERVEAKIEARTTLGVENAAAQTIILGAVDPETEDPETGYKFQVELTSKGAAIRKVVFSNGEGKGFDDRDPEEPKPLEILSPVDGGLSMANKELVFIDRKSQLPLNQLHWKTEGKEELNDGSQVVRFEAIINDSVKGEMLRLVKTYKVFPGNYHLNCDVTIENLSSSEQYVRFNMAGPMGLDREGIRADMRKAIACFKNAQGDITREKLELKHFYGKKSGGVRNYQGDVIFNEKPLIKASDNFLWVAAVNKYFASIVVPIPEEGQEFCDWVKNKSGWLSDPDGEKNSGDENIGVNLYIAPSRLSAAGQPRSSREYNFLVYIGPKNKRLFDNNEMYRNLGFAYTIDFMACMCPASVIRPLAFGILAAMNWMYDFMPNYGIIIIIFVFIFRLIIHPLTKKSQVSMSKMGKLAPLAAEIKKKYANNKAEMNKQMMALYREQGASPIMGMLPMFVQMPVWIALWSAINASVEMRGAAFLPFWITDLSVPDALFRFSAVTIPILGWTIDSFNLLPLLMGVAFYLQQKLMPKQAAAAANPQVAQQQKMMMIMMPILFPVMLYNGPSGVNLYIMSSVFAGVVEQYFIRKHIREKEETESLGLVSVTSKTGGKVKKKKPKPFFKNM